MFRKKKKIKDVDIVFKTPLLVLKFIFVRHATPFDMKHSRDFRIKGKEYLL